MMDINTAWSDFCDGTYDIAPKNTDNDVTQTAPKSSDLYISTKTKISYLSQPIDINNVFWKIPVHDYHIPQEGVIKKQMKLNSHNEDDFNELQKKISSEKTRHNYVDEHIIQRIVNADGRIKYKDVRKISVGLSKKDIISYRCKKKGAFYNCFVLIIRIKFNGKFKEIHVKIFNTGKLEIPGIQNDDLLIQTLDILVETIKKYVSDDITYDNTIYTTYSSDGSSFAHFSPRAAEHCGPSFWPPPISKNPRDRSLLLSFVIKTEKLQK